MLDTRIGSYAAAGLVASLTLAVFYQLRDYGPESALRKFQMAAISGDREGLQRVCKQGASSQSVQILQNTLRQFNSTGARVRMGMLTRETRIDKVDGQDVRIRSVVAEVRYYMPGRVEAIHWVVDLGPAGWMVNAEETVMFPFKKLGVGQPG
jgi:hypothetical protein